MDPNLLPKWRQRRLLRKKLMYGHDFVRHSLSNEKEDNKNDNNEGIFKNKDTLNYLSNPESYHKGTSTNLPDHTTKENADDDDRLAQFLADFLKIKEEENMSDKIASKFLNLFASFLPKGNKCPRTIEDCRSFLRNSVPEVFSICNQVEEHDIGEGRLQFTKFIAVV